MHIAQSIVRGGSVLGVISLVFLLPGCSTSGGNREPAVKEVTSAEAHHPVKFGPATSKVPLCGAEDEAVHHYSCSKGYSSY
jgi:hypothetical protein